MTNDQLLPLLRAIYNAWFIILLEDTGRTFNINMHSYDCFAVSEEEAVGKMYKDRPEFKRREIISITIIK